MRMKRMGEREGWIHVYGRPNKKGDRLNKGSYIQNKIKREDSEA